MAVYLPIKPRPSDVLFCRVSPRQARPFCFGKRTKNHGGRGVALRVPCAVSPNPAARKLAVLVWSFRFILEKLRGLGGGGTSLRICQLLDRPFETSPIHTPNVDEESRGITHDRRFGHKLTLVWPTPW